MIDVHGHLGPRLSIPPNCFCKGEAAKKKTSNSIQGYIPLAAFLLDTILVDGVMAEGQAMHSDVYRRLYATCLTMAEQSNSLDARARWLALAQDCENLRGASSAREGQSKSRSMRLTKRSSVDLRAANVQ